MFHIWLMEESADTAVDYHDTKWLQLTLKPVHVVGGTKV